MPHPSLSAVQISCLLELAKQENAFSDLRISGWRFTTIKALTSAGMIEVLYFDRMGKDCSAERWLSIWQPSTADGRAWRLTTKAAAFLEAHAARATAKAAQAALPACSLPEYRVTRPRGYGPGTAGHQDPAGREGHYVRAASEGEALLAASVRFPGEPLEAQLWKIARLSLDGAVTRVYICSGQGKTARPPSPPTWSHPPMARLAAEKPLTPAELSALRDARANGHVSNYGRHRAPTIRNLIRRGLLELLWSDVTESRGRSGVQFYGRIHYHYEIGGRLTPAGLLVASTASSGEAQ